jgi:nitrogenase molybdenum-iron protein NifN
MSHPIVAKPVAINPLKSSAPLGAAMAFLGIEGGVPLFHGSQGCTAFALVALVRHFKETIPFQTTAMNEVSTILGGADHLEEALLNLKSRMKPQFIGVCSTALTETRGEDFVGDLRTIMERRAAELAGTKVVFASTPDFEGALETGWSKAVLAIIRALVPATTVKRDPRRVNILPGQHLTPADVEHIKDIVESFGLTAVALPDISTSLDGTVPEQWTPTSYGGCPVDDVARMGGAACTIAIGEHMRGCAEALHEIGGMPVVVLDRVDGLAATELVDAMLDAHFHFGGQKIAIGAEPDHAFALASLFQDMGAQVVVAITTNASPVLARVPADVVKIGDLDDLEAAAADVDLIVTHAHGRQMAARLHTPLLRVGFPIFDRLGPAHAMRVGYEGTRDFLFEIANVFLSQEHHPTPESLDPFRASQQEERHDRPSFSRH